MYGCSSEGLISSSEESETESAPTDRFVMAQRELERKRRHPARMHPELWFNEAGQVFSLVVIVVTNFLFIIVGETVFHTSEPDLSWIDSYVNLMCKK